MKIFWLCSIPLKQPFLPNGRPGQRPHFGCILNEGKGTTNIAGDNDSYNYKGKYVPVSETIIINELPSLPTSSLWPFLKIWVEFS